MLTVSIGQFILVISTARKKGYSILSTTYRSTAYKIYGPIFITYPSFFTILIHKEFAILKATDNKNSRRKNK